MNSTGAVRKYSVLTFNIRISKIRRYCLNETENALVAHSNMIKATIGLDNVIRYADLSYVDSEHVIMLVWCSVTIISYFYLLTNLTNSVSMQRLRHIYSSLDQYAKLVRKLEKHSGVVIKTVVKYINDHDLWQTEQLCSCLISRLLIDAQRSVDAINAVLDNIEADFAEDRPILARGKINCLTKGIQNFTWLSIHVEMINRLLNIYYRIVVKTVAVSDRFLKRGLTFCLRTLMQNMTNDDMLIIIDIVIDWVLECELDPDVGVSAAPLPDFCDMLEQACRLHRCVLYWDTLKDKLLTNVLRLIMSKKRQFCLLGLRLLHNLLDRHSNLIVFSTPKIYSANETYEIEVGAYHPEDKVFLKRYRELIHGCFLASIRSHQGHVQVLASVYTALALLIVEIPGGHTAASVACIAMHVQEFALGELGAGLGTNLSSKRSYRRSRSVRMSRRYEPADDIGRNENEAEDEDEDEEEYRGEKKDGEDAADDREEDEEEEEEEATSVTDSVDGDNDETVIRKHHCHAVVVSVMSLVCWVCEARLFNDYLAEVIMNRAVFAPFLNPPVRSSYQYALHHVLWNEPSLFFEDWEVRYGLWKCFRRPKRIEDTARGRWARAHRSE